MLDYKELLGNLIDDNEWENIKKISKDYLEFEHPILYLLKDENEIICSNKYNLKIRFNTKVGISKINQSESKFKDKVKAILSENDLQNVSSILGEVRCYGYLSSIFDNNVEAIAENNDVQTPDFKVKCEDQNIFIEVNTPQISQEEVKKFKKSAENHDTKALLKHITVFQKKNKSYINSIYEKLTNVKKDSNQLKDLNNPTILWVDLQACYINEISYLIKKSGPYFSTNDGNIVCNTLWYSTYACENTPMFECVNLHCGEGHKRNLPKTRFGGRFNDLKNNFISAIVYYGADGIIIYENPNALNKLPDSFIKYFSKGNNFRIENSRINFPTNDLKERIELEKKSINELAKNNFYKF